MLLTGCIPLQSPLNEAAMRGDTAQVQQLLDNGADINANSCGYTPLMSAARTGNTTVVEQLLGKGANVNATSNKGGSSALIYAAIRGQTDCVKVLLEHGANTEQRNHSGKSALDYARKKGYTKIVQLISAASQKSVVTPGEAAQPPMLPKHNTDIAPF